MGVAGMGCVASGSARRERRRRPREGRQTQQQQRADTQYKHTKRWERPPDQLQTTRSVVVVADRVAAVGPVLPLSCVPAPLLSAPSPSPPMSLFLAPASSLVRPRSRLTSGPLFLWPRSRTKAVRVDVASSSCCRRGCFCVCVCVHVCCARAGARPRWGPLPAGDGADELAVAAGLWLCVQCSPPTTDPRSTQP